MWGTVRLGRPGYSVASLQCVVTVNTALGPQVEIQYTVYSEGMVGAGGYRWVLVGAGGCRWVRVVTGGCITALISVSPAGG